MTEGTRGKCRASAGICQIGKRIGKRIPDDRPDKKKRTPAQRVLREE